MKRILIIVPFVIAVVLTGCLKDKPNVDFSQTGVTAEISTANTAVTVNEPASGLANFGNATLTLPSGDLVPDTVWFTVNIASDYPPKQDIPITLAIDQQALATYVADTTHVQYAVFPDSTFTIPSLTGTVKAGNMNRLDTFYVIFYPWKVDPASSYMLPLTITSAPGCTIAVNLSTIFFHVVGNPIAGPYTWDWTRWNNSDSSGATSGGGTNLNTAFVPTSPTNIEVHSGYYIQPKYEVSFTNTAGTLSNFTLSFNSADVATMTGGGVTVTKGPIVITADPVNKVYEFFYQVSTASGPRTVIDWYYGQ